MRAGGAPGTSVRFGCGRDGRCGWGLAVEREGTESEAQPQASPECGWGLKWAGLVVGGTGPWAGPAAAGAHLELVGGVEGDLADFGEALAVAHGIAQRQLRELEQRSLRRVPDHDALGTQAGVRSAPGCTRRLPGSPPPSAPALTLGTGTASWPDLKAARLHRVRTRHNARHVSEDWSNVCPGGQASRLGPRRSSPIPEPSPAPRNQDWIPAPDLGGTQTTPHTPGRSFLSRLSIVSHETQ